jgi:uncharacterized protein YdeI (YjbR/CyaY-like superfamily)
MKPVFFKSQTDFHKWLDKNHDKASELIVGFYKKSSGKAGITYKEALDEALCFGWIDGVRNSIDDDRWTIRFSPRKSKSIWSKVNVDRANELMRLGLMQPSGLAAFEGHEHRTSRYSYENDLKKLAPEYEKRFRRNKKAWSFWESQPAGYQRTTSWYVMSAKREETRARRLQTLIENSENGERIAELRRPEKRR